MFTKSCFDRICILQDIFDYSNRYFETLSSQDSYMDSLTNENRPLVITGPSGVGKGTLINKLMEEYEGHFSLVVSHTCRPIRPGMIIRNM